jgi:hypothetical protein
MAILPLGHPNMQDPSFVLPLKKSFKLIVTVVVTLMQAKLVDKFSKFVKQGFQSQKHIVINSCSKLQQM